MVSPKNIKLYLKSTALLLMDLPNTMVQSPSENCLKEYLMFIANARFFFPNKHYPETKIWDSDSETPLNFSVSARGCLDYVSPLGNGQISLKSN